MLEDVDLVVDGTSRIGVLGRNGAGKSTLLRCLAGLETPPRDGRALPADPERRLPGPGARPPRGRATAAYLRRRTGLADGRAGHAGRPRPSATTRADQSWKPTTTPWPVSSPSAATTTTPGAPDPDRRRPRPGGPRGPLARLSGGQRVKAGLAAILLARFDVLLLDEPTNNLDFDGLARLERFLATEDRPVVLVSHDRAFLSATTTRIAELDLHSHRLTEYGGGYDAFLEERRRRREQA